MSDARLALFLFGVKLGLLPLGESLGSCLPGHPEHERTLIFAQ